MSARPKNTTIAVLLALFLGGIGAHQFYLGRIGLGMLYLVFCWTFIPLALGFFEAFLMKGRVARYNRRLEVSKVPIIVAPVINEPPKRKQNEYFRLSSDEAHVLRVNQPTPKGLQKKLAEFVRVSGISRPPGPTNLLQLIHSPKKRIELRRDPENRYDSNAIEVLSVWVGLDGKEKRGHLGWVPRETAAEIRKSYPDGPIGATIKVIYQARPDAEAGIRLDLWQPRASRCPGTA